MVLTSIFAILALSAALLAVVDYHRGQARTGADSDRAFHRGQARSNSAASRRTNIGGCT